MKANKRVLQFAKYQRLRKAGIEKHAAVRQAKGGRYSVFQRDFKTYLRGKPDILGKPPVVVKRIPKFAKKVWKPRHKIRIPYKDRFHPIKAFPHNVAGLKLMRKESELELDVWVSRDTWDEVIFDLRDKLSKRIQGVINRQAKRGYFKFGLIIHADKERVSGDEERNVDKFVSVKMAKMNPDLISNAFIALHLAVREILRDYEWHLDKLYVLGDNLVE
jgi:hypothetical protein